MAIDLGKLTATACCCLIAFLVTLAAPPGPVEAAKWTEQQLPPGYIDEDSTPVSASLTGVSCPTESLCVAVGALNTLASSRAPTGGPGRWQVVHPPPPVGPGKTCIAGEPDCNEPKSALRAVSCASQSFCVVVTYDGFVYVSTDPTGGADAWSSMKVRDDAGAIHLTSVSCPTPSFCAAVSGGYKASGKVLTSTDPVSGSWQATQLGNPLDLRGVSCGTPTLCVAVGSGGRLFVSTNPTGGAASWRDAGTPAGPGDLEGVDCVSTLLCAAGNMGGNILTSTNPVGATSWREGNAGGSVLITDISCPTAERCLAVDNNGDVLTSTDPTAGTGSWQFENLIPFPDPELGQRPRNALFGASCGSPSFCALVGSDGRIFTSTDPFSPPTHSGKRGEGRKALRRPRTVLMFSDYFWHTTRTRRQHTQASFRFFSRSRVRGFECKRGRKPYRRCRSPQRYWVRHGRHVLRVRAIGLTGLRGPAAIKRFRVLRPIRASH
jgi:hypothetical protein